jgi:hypothetical protein
MVLCSVCSEPFWPTGRWRDDTCTWCFQANFAASQELRVQEEGVPLTPRQQAALVRIHEAQARNAQEDT